jgi:hypothetical protein
MKMLAKAMSQLLYDTNLELKKLIQESFEKDVALSQELITNNIVEVNKDGDIIFNNDELTEFLSQY